MKISILVSLFVTTFDSLTSLTDLGYQAGRHEFDVVWVFTRVVHLMLYVEMLKVLHFNFCNHGNRCHNKSIIKIRDSSFYCRP